MKIHVPQNHVSQVATWCNIIMVHNQIHMLHVIFIITDECAFDIYTMLVNP